MTIDVCLDSFDREAQPADGAAPRCYIRHHGIEIEPFSGKIGQTTSAE